MHELTADGDLWVQKGTLAKNFGSIPNTCRDEVMAIFGSGELGKLSNYFLSPPLIL